MKIKDIKNINRYWIILGIGLGCLVFGVVFGAIWMANPLNQFLGILTIALFMAGVIICIRQFRGRHNIGEGATVNITAPTTVTVKEGEPQPQKQEVIKEGTINSLNIYAGMDADIGKVVAQRVVFEAMVSPMGQPQRCLNLGKDYYVHIWDIKKGRLVPFILPDSKYTDPSILARSLALPAQRKYLRNRESLLRLIGPGLLIVGVLVGFITIIALSGG